MHTNQRNRSEFSISWRLHNSLEEVINRILQRRLTATYFDMFATSKKKKYMRIAKYATATKTNKNIMSVDVFYISTHIS